MALSNSSILRALDFCDIWVSSPVGRILCRLANVKCKVLISYQSEPLACARHLRTNGMIRAHAYPPSKMVLVLSAMWPSPAPGLASVSAVHLRPCDGK
jgi:hypothetical protein